MRVVFLTPAGVIGGAERVLLATVRGVRDHVPGAEPHVVLLADGPLRSALGRAGATVTVVPLPPALAGVGDTQLRGGGKIGSLLRLAGTAHGSALPAFEFVRKFRSAVAHLRPDLVHSNGLKTHLLAAVCGWAKVPVTWHVHDFFSERPLMARAVKLLGRRVAGAIAISEAVRRDFSTLLPKVPVTLVRNGVDTSHFYPACADGRQLDRLAGLPESDGLVRVGLVATYANWKGHDVFLSALSALPATLPVRGFVVGGPIYSTAGSQWSRADLERRAGELGLSGRVGFVPFQGDPADVYRTLDVVVHASTRPEPFGLTIAEAMSCGRAVVVSAAGGATELFREGVSGLGHAPGDANGLSGAIQKLVADPTLRVRLGQAARDEAIRLFSIDRFGTELASQLGRIAQAQ